MGFFDRFRRRAAMGSPVALGAFIDEQAVLLAEGAVRDYARLRAGDHVDAVFADATFTVAGEKAQWEAYPRALAMIGEVVLSMLRLHGRGGGSPALEALTAIVLEAFDRRTVPAAVGEIEWRAGRAEVLRSLNDLADRRPLPVESVADAHSTYYLAIMPLHENLRGDDFPALRGLLQAALAQVREILAERADFPLLAERLAARPQVAHAGADSPRPC